MVSVELVKFEIINSESQSGLGPAIILKQSYDIQKYIIDGTLNGDYRIEMSKPYDMGVSNVSLQLTRDVNEIVTIDLERMPVDTYSYYAWGLRLKDFPQLSVQPATSGFLGILDSDNSFLDLTNNKWVLNFSDILKTLYDCWEVWTLQDMPSWHYMVANPPFDNEVGYNLRKWLAQYNRISIPGVGQEDYLIVNTSGVFVEETYKELANRRQSVNGFLQMLLVHYGALMYIDVNGKIVFKNRNLINEVPVTITDAILEEGYEGRFASNQVYDSILVTSLYNIPDKIHDGALLLYYENGSPVYREEYIWGTRWDGEYYAGEMPINPRTGSEWTVQDLQNKKYLDLREYHVYLKDNTPPFDTYNYEPIHLFLSTTSLTRGYGKTQLQYLNDYYDLMNPRPLYNCIVSDKILNDTLPLLRKVRLGNVNFRIASINRDYTKETSILELSQTL